MFAQQYSKNPNSVKQKDPVLLQKLLNWSLWVARIYMFSGIGAVGAYSLFASIDTTGDIIFLLQWNGGRILGIIYLLTVQSILASRDPSKKTTPDTSSSNPSRPSIMLPIVDVVFLAMLAIGGSYATFIGTYFGSWIAVCGFVFTIIQIIASICLIIVRVMVISESNRKFLFAPFCDGSDAGGPRVRPQILTLLPGKSHEFIGEHPVTVFLRVLTLVAFMCGIVSFAVYVTIVQPSGLDGSATEMNIQVSQDSAIDYPSPNQLSVYVIFSSSQASTDILEKAVNVTMPASWYNPTFKGTCERITTTTSIMLSCVASASLINATIAIDFSLLSEQASPAYVYVGNRDDSTTSDDLLEALNRNAMPFPLVPGAHYSAFAKMESRQIDVSTGGWFFGMFSDTKVYNIGNIFRFFTDTTPSVSGDEVNNTATLRLTWPDKTIFPVITVVSDANDKTVLSGLSSVGGLIASLSGIFALLFGTDLAYHLLGSKPLGFFGLLHTGQERQLIKLNEIPIPSTPLEKFLGRFFIDFPEEDNEEEDGQNVSHTLNIPDTSKDKESGYNTSFALHDTDSLRYRGLHDKEGQELNASEVGGIFEHKSIHIEDETVALKRSEEGIRTSRLG